MHGAKKTFIYIFIYLWYLQAIHLIEMKNSMDRKNQGDLKLKVTTVCPVYVTHTATASFWIDYLNREIKKKKNTNSEDSVAETKIPPPPLRKQIWYPNIYVHFPYFQEPEG
jgi:uncharacterized membrane protein YwzB